MCRHPDCVAMLSKCFDRDQKLPTYSSTDMKTGVNLDNLTEFRENLTKLMGVDKRGGYYGQPDMAKAMAEIFGHRKEDIDECASRHHVSGPNETFALMAYSVRVMCSHIREKRK
eukprot:1015287-Pyramimonas_sp.AAC.1